jgi:hypothetical protein
MPCDCAPDKFCTECCEDIGKYKRAVVKVFEKQIERREFNLCTPTENRQEEQKYKNK